MKLINVKVQRNILEKVWGRISSEIIWEFRGKIRGEVSKKFLREVWE